MVDTSVIWVGMTVLMIGIGTVAFVLQYASTREYDYVAFAFAVVWIAGAIELSMANGYLPENPLYNTLVGGCVLVTVVVGAFGLKRQGVGFSVGDIDVQ